MSVTIGILATIGAQFATGALNHKQSSKQMKKLQALQQEYEEALQQDGFKRAWDKHNQLCALQKEMEKELHQRRIDNIEQSFNRSLDITAYSQALKNWPLRVLPFVMKDESLLSAGTIESNNKIALHCLLTRGNDDNFNKAIFRELEVRLSQHFNLFWGASSSHPILFYSGAWKEMHDASAVVDNLYNQLEQLPTIVISPWIDENNEFYFKVSVWGIPNVNMKNSGYKPEGITFRFKQKLAEYTKEEIQQILNELNPAITAFIGYIADQYYWRYNNTAPLLPKLIESEMVALPANISADFKQQYIDLLENYISDADSMILHPELSLGLCKSIDNEIRKKEYLQKVFITYCQRYSKDVSLMAEALQLECFTKIDLPFLKEFIGTYEYDDFRKEIEDIIEFLLPLDFDYSILEMMDIDKLKSLANAGNAVAMFRLGEIYEYSIGVDYNIMNANRYYSLALSMKFILAEVYAAFQQDNTEFLIKPYLKGLQHLGLQGIESAIIRLSQLYFNGCGVTEDKEYAIQLVEQIDDMKNPYSLYWGAKMVIDSLGEEQAESIEELLIKSAEIGYIKSQILLMDLYRVGYLVDKDPKKSVAYAQKAAKQGCIPAITRLGEFYATGFGLTRSIEYAKDLLKLSADNNDEEAIDILKQLK